MVKNLFTLLVATIFSLQAFSQGSSCTDATQITASGNYNGTTAGFTQEFWYILPLTSGNIDFSISSAANCGTVVDIAEHNTAQTGDCVPSNSNRIVSNVTSSCSAQMDNITIPVTAGRYYYIQVAGFFVAEAYTLNINTTVVLPVELMSQTVNQKGNSMVLEWETASEQNNSHYIIERKTDREAFTEIGQIEGSYTTFETTKYQFIDKNPSKNNYYRLVQYDFDGNKEIFPVMQITMKDREGDFSLYDNGDELVLKHDAFKDEEYQFAIFNTAGQLVHTQTLFLAEGFNQISLNEANLLDGVYVGVLQSPTTTARAKFLKH